MRRIVLALASLLLAVAAHAADGRKYAVPSLIGDEMLVVGAQAATGQRVTRNSRNFLRLDDPRS